MRHAKPPASRAESAEVYVVAQGFRGTPTDARQHGRGVSARLPFANAAMSCIVRSPTPNAGGSMEIRQALTFDDVLLVPAASGVLPDRNRHQDPPHPRDRRSAFR